MGPDAIVTRNDELMWAPVDQEIVFLNQSTDSYVALDEVGRRVWELLEHPLRVTDLVDLLSAEFEGPRQTICSDVLALLRALGEEGIVTVDERSTQ